MSPLRVTGTTDLTEIAAVVAALGSARTSLAPVTGYERWRQGRIAAVRRAVNAGKRLRE